MVKITLTTGEEIIANSIYYEQNLAIIDYDNAYSASLIENVERIREEDSWKYQRGGQLEVYEVSW